MDNVSFCSLTLTHTHTGYSLKAADGQLLSNVQLLLAVKLSPVCCWPVTVLALPIQTGQICPLGLLPLRCPTSFLHPS